MLAAQGLLPPLSRSARLRCLIGSARRDALAAARHPASRLAPDEATFRDASRIARAVAAGAAEPENRASLDEAMRWFDRAAALRLSETALGKLSGGSFGGAIGAARDALARLDGPAVLSAAEAFAQAARTDRAAAAARGALVATAATLAGSPAGRPAEMRGA